MNERATEQRHDPAECGCGCDRRGFLTAMGAAAGAISFTSLRAGAAETAADEGKPRKRTGATTT